MDRIFNKGKFWVDSIFDVGNEYARARIIPDINSEYFPPWHTRIIEFPTSYLEPEFFEARLRSDRSLESARAPFKGAIVQGQYYDISGTREIVRKTESGLYDVSEVDLYGAKRESPVSDEITRELRNPDTLSSDRSLGKDECRLYCFNVGQGDSSLLIVNGNAYLIDTNIYAGKNLSNFISKLESIFNLEEIPFRIKALIITHKHLDHLRGAHKLLASDGIFIDRLIMNHKYKHSTGVVSDFLLSAEKHIPEAGWIDGSEPFSIKEGTYQLNFVNPTSATNTKKGASDINDSSIVFTVMDTRKPDGNQFVLTGDTSFPILENSLAGSTGSQSFLKVSHHGSRTGISDNLVRITNSEFASISAGNSEKYKHPHNESMVILNSNLTSDRIFVSKKHRKTVCCDLRNMHCTLI